MKIHDFISARITEARVRTEPQYRDVFDAMMVVVEMHKNWPTLVTTEPTYEPPNFLDDFEAHINSYRVTMTQRLQWMTGQEYVKIFGVDPPTTPMLRRIASIWKDHPEFQSEWELSQEEWAKALGQQSL